MEALQEFKIQTSGLWAEFGRTGGGVFDFVMRSGQNQSHRPGFGPIRNEALNANTFLNNAAGRPKSRDRQSNFGRSFGGPVRDSRHATTATTARFSSPRPRSSGCAPTCSAPQPIGAAARDVRRQPEPAADHNRGRHRPAGTANLSRRHLDPLTLREVNGAFVADPFPGNIIPANRISPTSKRIGDIAKKHYAPISDALTANNLFPTQNQPEFDQNQWSFRSTR